MNSMTTSIITTGSSAFAAITAAVGRRVIGIGRWFRAQRDYRLLCQMDESALKDLGLRSSDLRDATAVGLFGDPTLLIAGRADERHAKRHR
jgi:uncharacterized protein YjiS (DUF1127 family)